MVDLTLANGDSPQSAGDNFYQQQGIAAKSRWQRVSRNFRGVSRNFGVSDQQGSEVIEGASYFVQDGERIYQLLGYGQAQPQKAINWRAVDASLKSMRRLSDRKILSVQPMRVEMVRLDRALSVDDLSRLGADVPDQQLMLINRFDPGQTIPAGTTVKVPKGFNPARGLPR